jgi:ribosomal protein S16
MNKFDGAYIEKYGSYDFWNRYFAANESERHSMLASLPIFKRLKDGVWFADNVTTTLLKSYIEDAAKYIILDS